MYDIWLKEVPENEGLSFKDIMMAMAETGCNEGEDLLPVEYEGNSSFALGFMTLRASELLPFLKLKMLTLESFIGSILNDMELETADGIYRIPIVNRKEKFIIRLRR